MADNVEITAGSGTSVGTDDVSGVHYQRVKLTDGTADSSTAIPGGANGLYVQGQVAHDGAAAGNPLAVGAKAVNALPAAVANADAAALITDLVSRLITLPYANPENCIVGHSGKVEDTTATNVIATDSGASLKWYVTSIMVTNSDATVGTLVTIEDDEGTPTKLWEGWAAAAGGGFAISFPVPVPTAANAHIHVKCGTTSSEVYCSVAAFKAP